MTGKNKSLSSTRIGIFGKGGSGKTTVIALLARGFRDHGYEVCVLDADSTNIGLHQALGLDKAPVSLIDYYGGSIFEGGRVTCPVDDPTPLPGGEISLDKLPGKYYAKSPEGILLLSAGKIGDQGPRGGCDGPISKISRDFKIVDSKDSHITLVDFKAGFEDSARGVVTSLDWAVVVVDPTSAAIEIASNMKDMVRQIRMGVLPATCHLESPEHVEMANKLFREAKIRGVSVVLNRINNKETERYMFNKLKEKGITPIGLIHEDHSISLCWLKGFPLQLTGRIKNDIQKIIINLGVAYETYSADIHSNHLQSEKEGGEYTTYGT